MSHQAHLPLTDKWLVLAPSGTGKTFLSNLHPQIFVDGDKVIAQTIGWPEGEWWRDKRIAAQHNKRAMEALRLDAQRRAEVSDFRLTLFNTDPAYVDPNTVYGVWLTTEKQQHAHLEKRAIAEPDRPTPNLEEASANRERLRAFARAEGLSILAAVEQNLYHREETP